MAGGHLSLQHQPNQIVVMFFAISGRGAVCIALCLSLCCFCELKKLWTHFRDIRRLRIVLAIGVTVISAKTYFLYLILTVFLCYTTKTEEGFVSTLLRCMASSSGKRNVTIWRPSVRLSVCLVGAHST